MWVRGDVDVKVKTLPSERVAYTTYQGPLDRVGASFEHLQTWARKNELPDKPITGVFVENHQPVNEEGKPHGASLGTAEAWLTVGSDVVADPDAAVEVKETGATRAACAIFEGNPEDILRFTDAMRRFLGDQALTLAEETRLVYRDADWADITNWVIEVQVPVLADAE